MTKSTQPAGAVCDGGTIAGPYVFRELVLRNNIIRHLDNAVDPFARSFAFSITSCEHAVVEGNIISFDVPEPIFHNYCGVIKYFNNETPFGKLIQGSNRDQARLGPELATDIDDVLLLSFLQ